MGGLFSKGDKSNSKSQQKSTQISEHDRAILQIKQQRDKVKQFQRRLTTQLETERQLAKQLVQNNQKDKALLLLRKKKATERILERSDQELFNIEQLITDIEFKKVEQSVLQGIQIGNTALKQLNEMFSIQQIETILEETEEGVRKQQEISDLISGLHEAEIDEQTLEQELQGYLNIVDEPVQLPDVPTELPKVDKVEVPSEKVATSSTKQKKVAVEA